MHTEHSQTAIKVKHEFVSFDSSLAHPSLFHHALRYSHINMLPRLHLYTHGAHQLDFLSVYTLTHTNSHPTKLPHTHSSSIFQTLNAHTLILDSIKRQRSLDCGMMRMEGSVTHGFCASSFVLCVHVWVWWQVQEGNTDMLCPTLSSSFEWPQGVHQVVAILMQMRLKSICPFSVPCYDNVRKTPIYLKFSWGRYWPLTWRQQSAFFWWRTMS